MDDKKIIEPKSSNQEKPKKRGSSGVPPQSRANVIQTDDDRRLVSRLLTETLTEYRQPKVKSDEELMERLDGYFKRCANEGRIPTVEEMCLCTGYSQATVWDWEKGRNKGFSDFTSEIIKKSKEFLQTFDAKLAISGKLNFLTYCFRAKNYYGMQDKVEHVITPNPMQIVEYDVEDIKKRYLDTPATLSLEAPNDSDSDS